MNESEPGSVHETINGVIDLVLYGAVMHVYGWKGLALSALVESGYHVTMWRRRYFAQTSQTDSEGDAQ